MSRREREAAAAARLRECRAALAKRGGTAIAEAMGGEALGRAAADWRHYPPGEVYDPVNHLQYFFHRHPQPNGVTGSEPIEPGHFHVFVRGEGMPAGAVPMLLPELAVANAPLSRQSAPLKRGGCDEVCHIVAIAVDGRGEPCRLFTTNRWVTGETWYRADDIVRVLDRLRPGSSPAPALLSRWIEALVCLFQPDIAALLRARDKALADWRWRWPRGNAWEDQRLEITSASMIDLAARLAAAEGNPVPAAGAARLRLPPMAEGWGA